MQGRGGRPDDGLGWEGRRQRREAWRVGVRGEHRGRGRGPGRGRVPGSGASAGAQRGQGSGGAKGDERVGIWGKRGGMKQREKDFGG